MTPRPHGLGLHASDVAYLVGHKDGGKLIEDTYLHRRVDHALERIHEAMEQDGT